MGLWAGFAEGAPQVPSAPAPPRRASRHSTSRWLFESWREGAPQSELLVLVRLPSPVASFTSDDATSNGLNARRRGWARGSDKAAHAVATDIDCAPRGFRGSYVSWSRIVYFLPWGVSDA